MSIKQGGDIMEIKSIAIYLDTENIKGTLNIQDLLDDINLKVTAQHENTKTIFAFKKAVGDQSSIKRFRTQLKELNFEIQDTPHITGKKNRADLIICLDAFEKIYIDNPVVDLFVFLTNDSDYSVIMDILRRYNKEVWLVATEEDAQRSIFKSAADNILLISDYQDQDPKVKLKQNGMTLPEIKLKTNKDKRTFKAILKVFKSYEVDMPYQRGHTNNSFRLLERTLDISDTQFKNFNGLYKYLNTKGIIKLTKDDKNVDIITVTDKKLVNRLLESKL
jgi:hypothetical protein